MGNYPQICYTFLLTATLVACDSDSGTNTDPAAFGEGSQSGLLSDENSGNSGSIINATNYLSLLRTGLDIAQNRLAGESLFLELPEFTGVTGDTTGNLSNQPCAAAGTYDLFSTQSDDPGGVESGFVNTPIDTYRFTACTSTGNTAISGSYEVSEFFETEFLDFTASTEEFDATITDIATSDDLEDIAIRGTIGRSRDGGTFSSTFDVESFTIVDDSSGTIELMGTGSVDNGDFGFIFDLDITLSGSAISSANPGAPLRLETEASEAGSNPTLVVGDGSVVSAGVVVLSAADGSSVRAAVSSNEFIADITLSDGISTTLDTRSWIEILP